MGSCKYSDLYPGQKSGPFGKTGTATVFLNTFVNDRDDYSSAKVQYSYLDAKNNLVTQNKGVVSLYKDPEDNWFTKLDKALEGHTDGSNAGDPDYSAAKRVGRMTPAIIGLVLSGGSTGIFSIAGTILNANTVASECVGAVTGSEDKNILREGFQSVGGKTGTTTFDVIDAGVNLRNAYKGLTKVPKLKDNIEAAQKATNTVIDAKSSGAAVDNIKEDIKK